MDDIDGVPLRSNGALAKLGSLGRIIGEGGGEVGEWTRAAESLPDAAFDLIGLVAAVHLARRPGRGRC